MPEIGLIIIAVAATVLVAALLLWFGFKLFLLPLRLIWRFGRTVGEQIGAIPLTLVLVWTVALQPAPFIQLWKWFLRFGQALLFDTPRQLTFLLSQLPNTCSGNGSNCSSFIGAAVSQIWTTAIGNPIRDFAIPVETGHAALIFAIGVTVAMAVRWLPWTEGAQAGQGKFRTVVALSASFLFALYLAITAIIGIPVVGEKPVDVSPHHGRLVTQLKEIVASIDKNALSVSALDEDRQKLPKFEGIDSRIEKIVGPVWTFELNEWQASRNRLADSVSGMPKDATIFQERAQTYFQYTNEGHLNEMTTQRHLSSVISWFQAWINDYRANLEECRRTLSEGLGRFRTFHESVKSAMSPETSQVPFEALNAAQQIKWRRCKDEFRPDYQSYLAPRMDPADTLGVFGTAAGWLLRTESFELALIIGLLGFGFLGALTASFVKQFAATPGNELPPLGFIFPALVRGVGAAILVFLVAKGGTAILMKGGDGQFNAYAVFAACFVAAVFSEDVWESARKRQKKQLDGEGRDTSEKGKDGKPGPDKGDPPKSPQSGAGGVNATGTASAQESAAKKNPEQ